MNFEFIAKFMECLTDELGYVIEDNSSRYTEAVYYMMFDKLDHAGRLYFL